MTTTLVSMPGGASEGEAFVTSCVPMPAATDTTSPCSTSVATADAGEAGCGMGLAGAGRAAEASETVVASTRSGGRRSSAAAAGSLAAALLFRVAIVDVGDDCPVVGATIYIWLPIYLGVGM